MQKITHSEENAITCVTFSNNGTMLATGSTDKTVKIFNTTAWKCLYTFTHSSKITSLDFSKDDECIITTCHTSEYYLWNIKEQ